MSRFRFWEIWSRKKSIGFGFRKIWSRKKVSVSVSENLVSEEKYRFRFRKNLVSEKSLGFGFGKFGIVKKVSVSVSVKILVSSFSAFSARLSNVGHQVSVTVSLSEALGCIAVLSSQCSVQCSLGVALPSLRLI